LCNLILNFAITNCRLLLCLNAELVLSFSLSIWHFVNKLRKIDFWLWHHNQHGGSTGHQVTILTFNVRCRNTVYFLFKQILGIWLATEPGVNNTFHVTIIYIRLYPGVNKSMTSQSVDWEHTLSHEDITLLTLNSSLDSICCNLYTHFVKNIDCLAYICNIYIPPADGWLRSGLNMRILH
jgi:hypothetical protein